MSDHPPEGEVSEDAKLGRAILSGVKFGFPIALIGLTFAVWLMTDLDLADSFATALLPGILLGGFAGGFAGLARTMD